MKLSTVACRRVLAAKWSRKSKQLGEQKVVGGRAVFGRLLFVHFPPLHLRAAHLLRHLVAVRNCDTSDQFTTSTSSGSRYNRIDVRNEGPNVSHRFPAC